MAFDQIIDAVAATLSGVEGMGVVHKYERWSGDWTRFLDLFRAGDTKADRRINGWTFSRTSVSDGRRKYRTLWTAHGFVLRGIYGLSDEDASELTFQGQVDSVREAFQADETLGGVCLTTCPIGYGGTVPDQHGLSVRTIENRTFGNTLCHYAEGTLYVVVEN